MGLPPSPEQRALLAAHVQRLISSPEWDMYIQELKNMEQRVLESLAEAPQSDILKRQGVLHGIREVIQLPQILIAQGRRP